MPCKFIIHLDYVLKYWEVQGVVAWLSLLKLWQLEMY